MARLFKAVVLLVFPLLLSACTVPNQGGATLEEVQRAAYSFDGPPKLTLFTMLSNRSGSGAHTSLLINGSQRVAFDPAGSFRHPQIVSRNDTVYGMTPYLVDQYTRFHARETYHVVIQELVVSQKSLKWHYNWRSIIRRSRSLIVQNPPLLWSVNCPALRIHPSRFIHAN